MKKKLLVYLLLLVIVIPGYAQNEPTDCTNAIIICGNTNLELNSNGTGIDDFALPSNNAPDCGFTESQSLWIKVDIVQAGTLAFTITPESTSPEEDYDFAIYGPNVTCDNLGSSIRCSSTNPPAAGVSTLTGLNDTETDTSEGPGASGNGFVRYLDVLAGEEYLILIDNFSQNGGFDLEFTGTALFPENPTNQIATGTIPDFIQCDVVGDTNDGLTNYNLDINTAAIIGSQNNVTVTYHNSEEDANIGVNPLASPYLSTQATETIYTRIENTVSGCFIIETFMLNTITGPAITTPTPLQVCDTNDDGNDTNGIASFILSSKDSEILNNLDPNNNQITYHLTQNDADTGTGAIDKNNPFNNTTNPQTIYIRAESLLDPFCFSTETLELQVNPLPAANSVALFQCDEYMATNDGITLFNLNEAIDQITNGETNRNVLFYENLTDAQNQTSEITNTNSYQNTQPNQQLFIRVVNNTTNCFRVNTLDLQVSITSANDAVLRTCDQDSLEDGITEFDLTQANTLILQGIAVPNLVVSYYATNEDALSEQNPITSYNNTTPYTQGQDIVYARVEDDQNQCFGINQVALYVNPLPDIEEEQLYFLCQNEVQIEVDSGLQPNDDPNDFNFLWDHSGETSETIFINQAGSYTVTVTSILTGCSKQRTVQVNSSSIATIQNIEIVDASDNNTVTITAEGQGTYEYAIEINEVLGDYQDSPIFTNVPPGFHTIYVRDKNGCTPITRQNISVIGFPKYFTPNGDGFHETWSVEGISGNALGNSIIYIFDRFGKLLKQLVPGGNGWDGTYNGQLMPSSDYWYKVQLGDGRLLTGSFSLIR